MNVKDRLLVHAVAARCHRSPEDRQLALPPLDVTAQMSTNPWLKELIARLSRLSLFLRLLQMRGGGEGNEYAFFNSGYPRVQRRQWEHLYCEFFKKCNVCKLCVCGFCVTTYFLSSYTTQFVAQVLCSYTGVDILSGSV